MPPVQRFLNSTVGLINPDGTPVDAAAPLPVASTGVIYDGTTALTQKFAAINSATSGDNTVVAAVTGKKIRVVALAMLAAAAVTARFESGAGGDALSGQMSFPANGGMVLPYNPAGWFETDAGELLNLELGGAVSVDGFLTYVEA